MATEEKIKETDTNFVLNEFIMFSSTQQDCKSPQHRRRTCSSTSRVFSSQRVHSAFPLLDDYHPFVATHNSRALSDKSRCRMLR